MSGRHAGARRGVLLLAGGLLAAAAGSSAASLLDFDGWMQDIDRASQEVHRSLARGDGSSAAAQARGLEALYDRVGDYFAGLGTADADEAVRMSRAGRDDAAAIVDSLRRQDHDAAARAALRITDACMRCHDRYKPLR
jgi:hypothetical protein